VYVLEGLKADDYRRLRAFSGKSAPGTFWYAVVNRLIMDFSRAKFGRKRIPKAVSRLGEWAEYVYRLLCWRRFSMAEAFEWAKMAGFFSGEYAEFEEESAPIRDAPCPEHPRFFSLDDENTTKNPGYPGPNPLEALIESLDAARKQKAVEVLRRETALLSETDRLLVRLRFGDDLSAAAAGKATGLTPDQARRRLKSLLSRFRERLLAEGIREM
jgi:RNA polymerase sigma factor (sigma-70 family)